MNVKDTMKNLILSFSLSILFVSSIFISTIIAYKFSPFEFAYIFLIASAYSFTLISKKKTISLLKWVISLPFSCLVLQYFRKTNYSIRALNWIFPYYGRPSAGGNFGIAFLTIALTVLCLLGGIVSLLIKPREYHSFEKIQLMIVMILDILIISAVLIMEWMFPSYEYIMQYILS